VTLVLEIPGVGAAAARQLRERASEMVQKSSSLGGIEGVCGPLGVE
jgi:hypothetical protein